MKQLKPFSFSEYKKIYSKIPRLCVDLVIKEEKGILLTYRKIDPKNVWHFPGGTVYYRESLIDAAKRVAKQELGVKIKIIKEIGVIDFVADKETFSHAVSVVFLAKIISGKIILDNQASDFDFFKKLPQQMYSHHGKFLKTHFNF